MGAANGFHPFMTTDFLCAVLVNSDDTLADCQSVPPLLPMFSVKVRDRAILIIVVSSH